MIKIRIKTNLGQVVRRLGKDRVGAVIVAGARDCALRMGRNMAMMSPTHWSTGAKLWIPESRKVGRLSAVASSTAAVNYLVYPLLGFRAHLIFPKNKGVFETTVREYTRKDGTVVPSHITLAHHALSWRKGGPVSSFRATAATLNKGRSFAASVWHPGFAGYGARVQTAVKNAARTSMELILKNAVSLIEGSSNG